MSAPIAPAFAPSAMAAVSVAAVDPAKYGAIYGAATINATVPTVAQPPGIVLRTP